MTIDATRAEAAPEPTGMIELARIDQRYRTLRTGIRTFGWVMAALFLYLLVSQLAGKITDVTVNLTVQAIAHVLADIKVALAITLAGATTLWALAERSFRHHKVERMQARIRELETEIDPNRSTSGLATTGKTHPRDRRS